MITRETEDAAPERSLEALEALFTVVVWELMGLRMMLGLGEECQRARRPGDF